MRGGANGNLNYNVCSNLLSNNCLLNNSENISCQQILGKGKERGRSGRNEYEEGIREADKQNENDYD